MGEDGGSDRSDTSKGAPCVSVCRVSKAALQSDIKDVRKILSDYIVEAGDREVRLMRKVSELGKVIVELKESLSSYTSCVRPHEGGVQDSSASGGIEKSAEGNSLRKSKKA